MSERFTAGMILGRARLRKERPDRDTKIGRVYDRLLADTEIEGVTLDELQRASGLSRGQLNTVMCRVLRDTYWMDVRPVRRGVWALFSTADDDRIGRKLGAAA